MLWRCAWRQSGLGGPTPPSLTPVVAANHCLPPLGRFDLEEIQRLVRDERCFVLYAVLLEFLARWARHDTNPLALLDDEIDALISVLRQMRAGYQLRLAAFPQSVVLCGTCATTASTSTLGHAPSALNQTVNYCSKIFFSLTFTRGICGNPTFPCPRCNRERREKHSDRPSHATSGRRGVDGRRHSDAGPAGGGPRRIRIADRGRRRPVVLGGSGPGSGRHHRPRRGAVRPVAFEDTGRLGENAMQLHLEHRVARRLLGRFTAQGLIHHDLSKASLTAAPDAIPRVILLGRLALYGPRAARLHEEIVPVTARWIDPARRQGQLTPYGRASGRRRWLPYRQRSAKRNEAPSPVRFRHALRHRRKATSMICCHIWRAVWTNSPSARRRGAAV